MQTNILVGLALGLGFTTAGLPAFASVAQPSVDELLTKSVQSVYSTSEESLYVMKVRGSDGQEDLRKMRVSFRRLGPEDAKLLIKFTEPADIRGTGILSILERGKAPDQWIYLPLLRKTRRLKGGNESESFLGSDFTIGDLTSAESDRVRYDYRISESDHKCGEAHCYQVVAEPKRGVDPSQLPYSKKVLEIRHDNFLVSKIEFYDGEGKFDKALELKKFHRDGAKNWVADKMEMRSLSTGHSTVIEIQERGVGKTPPDSVFTQSSLERG